MVRIVQNWSNILVEFMKCVVLEAFKNNLDEQLSKIRSMQ